jgi:hypothetical protein
MNLQYPELCFRLGLVCSAWDDSPVFSGCSLLRCSKLTALLAGVGVGSDSELQVRTHLYLRWSSSIPRWLRSWQESELGQITVSLSRSLKGQMSTEDVH